MAAVYPPGEAEGFICAAWIYLSAIGLHSANDAYLLLAAALQSLVRLHLCLALCGDRRVECDTAATSAIDTKHLGGARCGSYSSRCVLFSGSMAAHVYFARRDSIGRGAHCVCSSGRSGAHIVYTHGSVRIPSCLFWPHSVCNAAHVPISCPSHTWS